MNPFEGKTALVTGAGSGIGRALALELARRGARVVATDIAPADGSGSPFWRSEVLDVRDREAFSSVVERITGEAGGLDFLFNNAGVAVAGEAHELKPEHWSWVLDVNLGGTINGVLAAYPGMVRRRSGHIVNVASLAGLAAAPFLLPYAASKHGVVGLTLSLRAEAVTYGVRVSVACPSAIETPLLDAPNPSHLPPISWRPDMRRFLTRIAAPPYPPDRFAAEVLDRVAKNDAVIVAPSRARLAWRIGRFFPSMAEKVLIGEVARERATRR